MYYIYIKMRCMLPPWPRHEGVRMSSQDGPAAVESAGPEIPTFFSEPAIDRLTQALLKLSAEVWVLTERLTAVEALATRRGLAVDDELASFAFTSEEDAKLQAARAQFVRTVLGPLSTVSPA
jgi:hypothetical protein